jgi:magnesium-transporting ATPase (P-type)
MSGEVNPPSFYWSLERFWEVLSVVTLLLGVVVWLIEPTWGFTANDSIVLLTISIISVLQAIYFDRKTQHAEGRRT